MSQCHIVGNHMSQLISCVDPGILVRGGGGVQAQLPENSSDEFTVLKWFINGLFQRKL